MDPLILSRIQFAITAAFHYLYPPLSIGLGIFLVCIEGLYLWTKNRAYHQLARYWTHIFALTFAVGVATGIVMEFEFGTNWAVYSQFVGDVFGSALGIEALFAFFLESSFLGLLLFGWDILKPWQHFLATCCVCLGAHLSAVWIVIANSWMHTPTGFNVVPYGTGYRAEIVDFWAMVFNPSAMARLSHVLVGAWACGLFLVISVACWHLYQKRHQRLSVLSLRVALPLAMLALVLQAATGHWSGVIVGKHQPAKLAAFEGIFKTQTHAPLVAIGDVDPEKRAHWGLKIPGMLSWVVGGSVDTKIIGLNDIDRELWPPVRLTFHTYHLMLQMWGASLCMVGLIGWMVWRKKFPAWLCRLGAWSILIPMIGNQAGWIATEVGRQPWIVWGVLKTKEAITPHLRGEIVLTSLALFTIVYLVLFVFFMGALWQQVAKGPAKERKC